MIDFIKVKDVGENATVNCEYLSDNNFYSMDSKVIDVLLIGLLCFIAVLPLFNANVVSAITASNDWPMFGHDPSHSGCSNSTGPLSIYKSDNYRIGSFFADGSACVVAGIVYVVGSFDSGSRDFSAIALGASSGAKIWNYTIGEPASSPCVADGNVYIGSVDSFYALNAISGEKVWNFTGDLYDRFVSAPSVVNGIVYFGSDLGNFYALNASTGAKIWSFTATGSGHAAPPGTESSPSVVNDTVYFGSRNGNIYALNATSGEIMWDYTTGNEVWGSPCVAEGIIYIGSYDDNVYALNASSGEKIWNYTTGNGVYSTPCFANGVIYVGSRDHSVYALNASSGAKIWNYTTGDEIFSSPSFANGVIYVGSQDGNVYALNATSGEKIWSYYTTIANASPCLANGEVYVVAYNGYLYAFRDLPDQLNITLGAVVVSLVALIVAFISLWIIYVRRRRKIK